MSALLGAVLDVDLICEVAKIHHVPVTISMQMQTAFSLGLNLYNILPSQRSLYPLQSCVGLYLHATTRLVYCFKDTMFLRGTHDVFLVTTLFTYGYY